MPHRICSNYGILKLEFNSFYQINHGKILFDSFFGGKMVKKLFDHFSTINLFE